MRRYLPFVVVAAVGLLALGTGTLLYRSKRPTALAIPKNSSAPETAGTESMHIRGESNAAVTVEEFGDFQCPPCGKTAGVIRRLEQEYGSRLRAIFRQFPLAIHAHAQEAALASEAAGFQGRFWDMHDLLYREQAIWSKTDDVGTLFRGYAGMLGLNLDRFKTDMEGSEAKERVASDRNRGVALGVNSTPTLFVNNHQIPTPVEVAGLRAAINTAMKPQSPP